MGTSPSGSQEPTPPPDSSTVILLLGDIADTTWRMFVPTLGCIGLGFAADMSWKTKPWMTILGVIVGVGLAALLVRRQFAKIKREKTK